uniref:Uncharacterized protein n=1 Tax=Heterorhabditis bacteriophora TaxID=37862 RepID=A0A1I7WJP1_HETBA
MVQENSQETTNCVYSKVSSSTSTAFNLTRVDDIQSCTAVKEAANSGQALILSLRESTLVTDTANLVYECKTVINARDGGKFQLSTRASTDISINIAENLNKPIITKISNAIKRKRNGEAIKRFQGLFHLRNKSILLYSH